MWFCRLMMLASLALVALAGCAALHWGGEDSGRTPGVHVYGGSLFERPEISVTSNGGAKADRIRYQSTGKDGTTAEFEAVGIAYNQDVAGVVREQPAKVDAIARLQLTQVEYARVTWDGVRGLAAELLPVLKLLALAEFTQTETGLTATLPGGMTIGTRSVSGPAELQAFFREAAGTVQRLVPDDPGPVPGPASQPVRAGG